ncbi:hypothetical protein ACFQDD_00540 [Halorubrum pallidum]|uniref:Uncharacterized protein n=1 Tax=Halorubrum pallidum TaxID=1526114 RepID=A0ABD5SZT2_9EURY
MAHSDPVETSDPTILTAETESGETLTDEEFPSANYGSVDVERGDKSFTIAVGDRLITPGHEHGEVDQIVRHPDNANYGNGAWNWTVHFDYTGGSYGGCPLGELAKQLSNDAELVNTEPTSQ